MRFLCLCYYNEEKFNALSKEELTDLVSQCPAMDQELRKTGQLRFGAALAGPAKRKVLKPAGGKPTVTDGPYIETKELVGGVVMIEAADIDEAVKIASLHPAANIGGELGWCVEILPLVSYQES
ncbi:MAG: hypothetical protein IPK87_15530 [Planctomycetes bacterium]|nr:hypothetical protein [Planctomycetota bacterium]